MDFLNYVVFVLIGLWKVFTVVQTKRLDDYITHYEGLHYDTDTLHQRHLRYRRSNIQRHLVFKFTAYNRDFELELVPDDTIFTSDFKLQYNNGSTYPADISFIYRGKVKGDPTSYVHGSVLEGVFRGFITNRNTIYHIEHARRFFPAGHSVPYHSVIYKSDHVNLDPYRHRRAAGEGACGLERHRQWMKQRSTPVDINEKSSKYSKYANSDRSNSQGPIYHDTEDTKTPGHTREGPQNILLNRDRQVDRVKRTVPSTDSVNRLGARNTCFMYIRSDPVMWRYIKKQGMDDNVAKNEILSMFASHVAAINEIYKNTNFTTYPSQPTDYYYSGVQFRVQRTSVMTDESEHCNSSRASQFCNPNIDVSNFLDLTSREDHDQFCLAFTFTARDFSEGTLGLAWVASTDGAAGGICEKYKELPVDGKNVHKSLNTGIVTIINYGKRVVPTVSHLTFAHEVGHNFGSPHDTGICAPYNTHYPGASEGNYIMYASATHGDLPHNREFSTCSKDNMTRVLHSLLEQRFKKNCLENQEGSFCGNGIREDGEECDCGYEDDCNEKCCNPRHEPKRATDCKLRSTSLQCSPSQGPCCASNCQYIRNNTKLCRAATDCIDSSYCPGDSAECPSPDHKPDIETLCNDNLSVCQKGECTGSLCKKIGYTTNVNKSLWVECESSSPQCFLSCRYNGNDNITDTCISSSSIPEGSQYDDFRRLVDSVKDSKSKVPLPAGIPCDDFKGYCDVFSRCRTVNNNGPLARLQNLIFGNETWTMIREWIVEHWWIVLLIAMGLVLFMILFIKVCGVNTPSFDPKHKPVSKVTPTAPPPKSRNLNHQQTRIPRDQHLDAYDPPPRQQRTSPVQYHPRELYPMEKRQRY